MLRISHENQAIATRLGATASGYNRAEWEHQFQTAQRYMRNIARFPAGPAATATAPPPKAEVDA